MSRYFDQPTRLAHDVFISHASKDKRIADAICEELESSGLKCWIAPRDISKGEDWTKAIRDAIESSPLLLLVFSDNANAAPHIRREIANAYYTRRMIVPLRLAKALPQRDFLFYLKNARWIDADGQSADQDIKTLPMRIKGLLTGHVPASCHDAFSESLVTTRSATLRPIHARHGRLQSVSFGIPKTKRIAISVSIIVAVGLGCWLVAQQTDPGRESQGTYAMSMNKNGKISPTPAKTEASEAVPHYAFSRFGLWVPANASLTPTVDAKPGNTSSASQQAQAAGATPLQPTDFDREGGEKEDLSAEQRAKPGLLSHKVARAIKHRERQRTKAYARRVRPSEESAFRSVKDWVKSFFRRDPDL